MGSMGVFLTTIAEPQGLKDHRNWGKNHYFNGGGSPGVCLRCMKHKVHLTSTPPKTNMSPKKGLF